MLDRQFENLQTYVLTQRYEQDPGIVYELTSDELQILLGVVGEMEPIIDAINVLNGASIEQRAKDIGCEPEDFDPYDSDDDEIVVVADLIEASKIPSWR